MNDFTGVSIRRSSRDMLRHVAKAERRSMAECLSILIERRFRELKARLAAGGESDA